LKEQYFLFPSFLSNLNNSTGNIFRKLPTPLPTPLSKKFKGSLFKKVISLVGATGYSWEQFPGGLDGDFGELGES